MAETECRDLATRLKIYFGFGYVISCKKNLFLRNIQRGERQQKHPRHGKERGNAGQRADGDDGERDEGKGIFFIFAKKNY